MAVTVKVGHYMGVFQIKTLVNHHYAKLYKMLMSHFIQRLPYFIYCGLKKIHCICQLSWGQNPDHSEDLECFIRTVFWHF